MGGTNPVATWADPDHTAQTGTTYKKNLDNDHIVAKRLANAFAPHEAATPNMTVVVDAGMIFKDSALTEKAQQTTGTITAPSSNPRIDRVVIDAEDGTISVITGTEAGSPSPPAITDGKLPCCQVSLVVSQTSIVNADITDERLSGASGGGGNVEVKDQVTANTDVHNTTAETTLYSFSVPANTLGSDKALRLKIAIVDLDLAASGRTITVRLKYGATTLFSFALTAAGAVATEKGEMEFILAGDGGTSAQIGFGKFHHYGRDADFDETIDLGNQGTSAEDSTGALTLAVTVQNSIAEAGTGITLGYAVLEKLP